MSSGSPAITVDAPTVTTKTERRSRTVDTAGGLVSPTEQWAVFFVTAIPLLIMGLYAALHKHIYHVDALARSYSAVEVVRGFQPKLANLDLAWPPIPGLLQIPIAAVLPNVTANGGAGPIVSALSAAVCAVLLNRILARKLSSPLHRFAILLLTFANPMILGLSVTGVTEMPALVFLLVAWESFLRLDSGESPIVPLAIMGFATAALMLSRFEAVLAAVMMGGLVALYLFNRRETLGRQYVSAMSLSFAIPIFYCGLVFVFLCATITGNPFYFLTGPGSNTPYTKVIVSSTPALAKLVHDPVETVSFLIRASISFSPLMLPAFALAVFVAIFRRDLSTTVVCVLSFFLPLTQLLLLFDGKSAGWARYTFTSAIFTAPLLIWGISTLTGGGRAWNSAVWAPLIVLALIGNDVYAWTRVDDAGVRTDLRSPGGTVGFLTTLFGRHDATAYDPQVETEMAIAEALRDTLFRQEPNAIVLVDSSQATRIILFSERQRHFVSQNVIGFDDIVADPVGKVGYILVPDTLVERNEILQAYPGIFSGIYPQFESVAEFDGVFADAGNAFFRWGLFRVINPSTEAAG